MHASNKPQDPTRPGVPACDGPAAEAVRALWNGALGRTVRCVPSRRTVAAMGPTGWLFAKWRYGRGRRREAAAEWRWLHELPRFGLATPRPVAWLAHGARSLVVTQGVHGRALDAWAHDALAHGWLPLLVAWACARVAPAVRALHDAGLVYRDLYWNHVFAEDPRCDAAPTFLDVERVFAPRWRVRRWLVKDLAGLAASAPDGVPPREALRFLRAYLGGPVRRDRALLRAIVQKAARIRAHAPRFG